MKNFAMYRFLNFETPQVRLFISQKFCNIPNPFIYSSLLGKYICEWKEKRKEGWNLINTLFLILSGL